MERARVVAIVQARMSSQRLPGKILKVLAGRPSLDYLIDALENSSQLDGVILATSADATDDPTAEFADRRGLQCHRGDLANVASRMLGAAMACGADAFVRVNGDSPLMDPRLVDQAVELYRRGGADLVSNVRYRSFPKGQSVEVIDIQAMKRAVAAMTTSHDREHVTPFIYAHPDQFSIVSFQASEPRPEVQLSIDSPEDFSRCEAIVTQLGIPPWKAGWQACVRIHDQLAISERSI